MTPRLSAFLEAAPRGSLRVLTALSAAESLSDWLAQALIDLVCPGQQQLREFVAALHLAGFVVERNSEWHLAAAERRFLANELLKNQSLFAQCHAYLAGIAFSDAAPDHDVEVPKYLVGPVGRAYHRTALAPQDGLHLYSELETGSLAESWLAARLIVQQQSEGIIPADAIEPDFLRGMVLYREGKNAEAMRVLRRVAYSRETRFEVAVAAHLYGRDLRRRHYAEALRLLRKSVAIGRSIGKLHHEAQALHTLGQVLWQQNPKRAEDHLRMSLQLLTEIGDRLGQAEVLLTLGQKLSHQGHEDAEGMLRRSVEIEEAEGTLHGLALALQALGQCVARANRAEAEALLRRSIALGEKTGHLRHQAIAHLTLGKILWPESPEDARNEFLRSLNLNRARGDVEGESIVLQELRSRGLSAAG